MECQDSVWYPDVHNHKVEEDGRYIVFLTSTRCRAQTANGLEAKASIE